MRWIVASWSPLPTGPTTAPDGEPSTLETVARFIEREVAAGHTAPETLRRIRHGIISRERAELRDDASALLIEWRAGDERRLMPQTVL